VLQLLSIFGAITVPDRGKTTTSEGVKNSFAPQRGGIFVERGSRGDPQPQRGAISLLSIGQFCFKAAAFS